MMTEAQIAQLAEAQHEDYRKTNKGSKYDVPFNDLPPKMKDSAIDQARFFAKYLTPSTSTQADEAELEPAPVRRPLPPVAPTQLETPTPEPAPQPVLQAPKPAPQPTPVEQVAGYALQVTGGEGAAAIGLLELSKNLIMRKLV